MMLEKVKEEFINTSIIHLAATSEGDYKLGNKQHDKLMKLYQKIKIIERQEIFLEFLNHPNEGVRSWAATFTLKTNAELALSCLNDLTKLSTITSLSAETTIELWKKGELTLL